MIQLGTRARCGTRVDQWIPNTGRGQSIQVISVGSNTTTTTGCTVSGITVAVGDVIVLCANWEDGANRTCSLSTTGPALTADTNTGSSIGGIAISHGVVASAGTITCTSTLSSASSASNALHVLVLRGVDNTTPVDTSVATSTLGSSTTWTIPGITTASARTLVLAFAGVPSITSTITGPGAPWTVDSASGGGTITRAVAYMEHLPQGATGNCVLTIGSAGAPRYGILAFRAAA